MFHVVVCRGIVSQVDDVDEDVLVELDVLLEVDVLDVLLVVVVGEVAVTWQLLARIALPAVV